MEDNSNSADTSASATDASAADASVDTSIDTSTTTTTQADGSEADNNSSDNQEAMVPSWRVRKETEARRKAEEDKARLEAEISELRNKQSSSETPDEDVDTEVLDLVKKSAEKLGLVSKDELQRKELEIQVRQDVKDLEGQYANSGIPYDHQKVLDYAEEHNIPVSSKAALQAAYKEMNWDKIVEAERQKAIAGFKEGSSTSGEKPGSSDTKDIAEGKDVEGATPREKSLSRIRAARQKIKV